MQKDDSIGESKMNNVYSVLSTDASKISPRQHPRFITTQREASLIIFCTLFMRVAISVRRPFLSSPPRGDRFSCESAASNT